MENYKTLISYNSKARFKYLMTIFIVATIYSLIVFLVSFLIKPEEFATPFGLWRVTILLLYLVFYISMIVFGCIFFSFIKNEEGRHAATIGFFILAFIVVVLCYILWNLPVLLHNLRDLSEDPSVSWGNSYLNLIVLLFIAFFVPFDIYVIVGLNKESKKDNNQEVNNEVKEDLKENII